MTFPRYASLIFLMLFQVASPTFAGIDVCAMPTDHQLNTMAKKDMHRLVCEMTSAEAHFDAEERRLVRRSEQLKKTDQDAFVKNARDSLEQALSGFMCKTAKTMVVNAAEHRFGGLSACKKGIVTKNP